MRESFKIYSENFPFKSRKSAFRASRKGNTGLWVPSVLEVIVADWKFSVAFLDIAFVHDADVAATENRTLLWIASYSELSQVQTKFFFKIKRKNEWFQRLVSGPVFFRRIPGDRSIPADNFAELSFNQEQSIWNGIAKLVEFIRRVAILTGSV